MIYLSQLFLNVRDRAVRLDLANCHDLHSRIMTAFPHIPGIEGNARETFGVLYRVEPGTAGGDPHIIVQSSAEPNWRSLPTGYLSDTGHQANLGCKRIDSAYAAIDKDTEFVFRLRANPTRKVGGSKDPNDPLRGKRVNLLQEEDWLQWIARKGAASGFDLLMVQAASDAANEARLQELYAVGQHSGSQIPDVRAGGGIKVRGRKGDGHAGRNRRQLTFGSVLFEGRLRVSDAGQFRAALKQGIGSGKAYGFGLLSIAPVQQRYGG